MKTSRRLLFLDAAINLVLGFLLVTFPGPVIHTLGVPALRSGFYPSILGAVLIGIGIALCREGAKRDGLGLMGAISINLCGGVVLGGWLLLGGLQLPIRGYVFLWTLVILLVGISAIEWMALRRKVP